MKAPLRHRSIVCWRFPDWGHSVKQHRIVTALAVLCSLFILFLFLAQCSAPYRREQRERLYLASIRHYADIYGVPPAMVLAVIRTESDFYPEAVSNAGACGLMQLMPETFAFLQKEKFNEELHDGAIFDPETNIRYGVYYLSYLYKRFDSWKIALAAYNAGEGRVADWLREDADLSDIPFPETERYVKAVWEAYRAYRDIYP